MPETQRPKLMISYSRVDLEFVLKLFEDLKAAGINAWLDQIDIPAGSNWDLEIEAALEAASTILVVVSQHSRKSDNVKNEISHALELGKNVVPIILDKSPAPLMIARLQREDFTGSYDNALERLLVRLRRSGRTDAFEAISEEAVKRAIKQSADRISTLDGESRAGSAARSSPTALSNPSAPSVTREPEATSHRSASLEPLTRQHHSTPQRATTRQNGSKALAFGLYGAGALAIAAGLALWITRAPSSAAPKTEPASPAVVDNPGVEIARPAEVQPAPTTPKADEEELRKPASPSEEKTAAKGSTKLPAELLGSWSQTCDPTAAKGERVEAKLDLNETTAILNIYEYADKCGRDQAIRIITEKLDVQRVEPLGDGEYRIDVAPNSVSLMPSNCQGDWNKSAYLGTSAWDYKVKTGVLGALSSEYFGYKLVKGQSVYTTWRLKNGRLQYLPLREAGKTENTRPTLAKLSNKYEASRIPR